MSGEPGSWAAAEVLATFSTKAWRGWSGSRSSHVPSVGSPSPFGQREHLEQSGWSYGAVSSATGAEFGPGHTSAALNAGSKTTIELPEQPFQFWLC